MGSMGKYGIPSPMTQEIRESERFPSLQTVGGAEYAVVAHVRDWCHDSSICPLCKAQDRALAAERSLDQIISG